MQLDPKPSDGNVVSMNVILAGVGPTTVKIGTLYNEPWDAGTCTSDFLHVLIITIIVF